MSEDDGGDWPAEQPWTEEDERRYQVRRAREVGRLRRARRRAAVFGVVVLVVAGTGVYAAGLFQSWWTWPPFGGAQVAAPTASPCPTLTRTAAPPRDVQVRVYNSTDRAGLAASVAAQLQSRQFTVPEIANDPLDAQVTEAAQVRHGPLGLSSARAVAAQVPGAVLVDDGREGAVVDLALGEGFEDSLAATDTVATLTTPVPVTDPLPGCPGASPPGPSASPTAPATTG